MSAGDEQVRVGRRIRAAELDAGRGARTGAEANERGRGSTRPQIAAPGASGPACRRR